MKILIGPKMICTLLLAGAFTHPPCFAEPAPLLDESLVYSFIKIHPKANSVAEVKSALLDQGLFAMFDTSSDTTDDRRAFGILDGIYSAPDLSRAAFLIMGAKPSSDEYYQKMIADGHGYLLHSHTSQGSTYALYLRDFSEAQAEKLSRILDHRVARSSLKKIIHVASLANLFENAVVADARGEDCAYCGGSKKALPGQEMAEVKNSLGKNAFLEAIYGCGVGALKGMWNGSLGGVVDLISGGYHLLTDFKASAKSIWSGVNRAWDFIKSLATEFTATCSKLWDGFSAMDPKIQGEMFCETLTTVGTPALLSYFKYGKGFEHLAEILSRFERTEKYGAMLKGYAEARNAKRAVKVAAKVSGDFKDLNLAKKAAKKGYRVVKTGATEAEAPVQEQIVGKKVMTSYRIKEGRQAGQVIEVEGVVSGQSKDGIDLIDGGGKIHRISKATNEIQDVFVKPGFKHLENLTEVAGQEPEKLATLVERETVENHREPLHVLVEVPQTDGSAVQLTGKLAVDRKVPGKPIFEITPDHGEFNLRVDPKVVQERFGDQAFQVTRIDDPDRVKKISYSHWESKDGQYRDMHHLLEPKPEDLTSKISPANRELVVRQQVQNLSSEDPAKQARAIQHFANMKYDSELNLKGLTHEQRVARYQEPIEALHKVIESPATSAETRHTAVDALNRYRRANASVFSDGGADTVSRRWEPRLATTSPSVTEPARIGGANPFAAGPEVSVDAKTSIEAKMNVEANAFAESGKPPAKDLRTVSQNDGFRLVKLGNSGLQTFSGSESKVGQLVRVVYQPRGMAALQLEGKLISETPDGFQLMTAQGKTLSISSHNGEIGDVFLKPETVVNIRTPAEVNPELRD